MLLLKNSVIILIPYLYIPTNFSCNHSIILHPRHICTKYRGLFLGYFLTAYALRTVILLAFWRSFQRVPWQTNSIFIIVLFLLVLPQNALFCKGFRGYCDMLWNYRLWQIRARLSKLLLPVSSKVGSKSERVTTKNFIRHPYSTSVYTNNSIFDVYHIVFQLLPYYVILALLTDDTQICALIPLSHIPYLFP